MNDQWMTSERICNWTSKVGSWFNSLDKNKKEKLEKICNNDLDKEKEEDSNKILEGKKTV